MYRRFLHLYFTMSIILLVMVLFTVPFVDFQSAAGAVVKLNLLLLIPSCVGSGALLYRATRQQRQVYHPEELDDDPDDPGRDVPWDQE